MVNYQKGKVYKITSNQTDQVYIGSTCNPLCKRMVNHRSHYRAYLAGTYHRVTSFDILQYDDAVITLVEDFPCERKEQLLARERHHIGITPNCVNKHLPGRVHVEYLQDNKDVVALQKKANYEAKKQMVECECGSHVLNVTLGRHQATKKHLNYIAQLNQ